MLQAHIRKNCIEAGHPSLVQLSRSKLHRILTQGEIRPHKIRYYVERRDPEFERKMVEVLHVYKDVEIINAKMVEGTLKEPSFVGRENLIEQLGWGGGAVENGAS